MSSIDYITSQLLHCGTLDIGFLEDLLEKYNLDLYIDDVSMNYGKIDNVNILIYEAYREIKDMFLKDNLEEINSLGLDPDEFEEGEDYIIRTNYMCSSLEFNNESVNELYEEWRY